MIEIRTGSRLHFGLFQPGPPLPGQRRFGGAGMMIDQPGVHLRAVSASSWRASGPLATRALEFAHRITEGLKAQAGTTLPPQEILIEEAPPEHAGLGSGTQLGLAVARVLAQVAGRVDLTISELAALSGRGRRSGIGVHGFHSGGFLVDGGHDERGTLAPLVARCPVPEDWRIVMVQLAGDRDWHGQREQAVFDDLQPFAHTDRLCRLVLLGLLPALVEQDLAAFGEALSEVNALAGEAFSASQGGIYAGPGVAETVRWLRVSGVKGVGQSSWGPTVFGIVEDEDQAQFIASRVRKNNSAASTTVMTTRARNNGTILHRAG
jgi:beta-RFAP synthase